MATETSWAVGDVVADVVATAAAAAAAADVVGKTVILVNDGLVGMTAKMDRLEKLFIFLYSTFHTKCSWMQRIR